MDEKLHYVAYLFRVFVLVLPFVSVHSCLGWLMKVLGFYNFTCLQDPQGSCSSSPHVVYMV